MASRYYLPAHIDGVPCAPSILCRHWHTVVTDNMMKIQMKPLLAAAVCALLLTACGTNSGSVTLETLVEMQSEYNGERVATRGVLRTFDHPRHYWIEDDRLNRVALQPEDQLPPLVGRTVRVVGTFSYSPSTGRIITIERMELEL